MWAGGCLREHAQRVCSTANGTALSPLLHRRGRGRMFLSLPFTEQATLNDQRSASPGKEEWRGPVKECKALLRHAGFTGKLPKLSLHHACFLEARVAGQ